jgi:hypothetical protein
MALCVVPDIAIFADELHHRRAQRSLADNVCLKQQSSFSLLHLLASHCSLGYCSYLTLTGALQAGLTTTVAKQKLEYMVCASGPITFFSFPCPSGDFLQDTPTDGSAPRRKAFELKEIYGCDMLKPTE